MAGMVYAHQLTKQAVIVTFKERRRSLAPMLSEKQTFNTTVGKADIESAKHVLKCWPQFFDAISAGRKTHDLRRADDRDFRVGDVVQLNEFDPMSQQYTGRRLRVKITYITSAALPCALSKGALHPDYCILSIQKL